MKKISIRLLTLLLTVLTFTSLVLPFSVFAETETTTDTAEEAAKLGVGFWISIGIFAALIVALVVLGIIKRAWVAEKWKIYKSELTRKIVWMSWKDVRKSTIVVIVCVVALAVIIGLLDFAFSKGIIALGDLVSL